MDELIAKVKAFDWQYWDAFRYDLDRDARYKLNAQVNGIHAAIRELLRDDPDNVTAIRAFWERYAEENGFGYALTIGFDSRVLRIAEDVAKNG